MSKKHPSADLLALYAAGNLPLSQSLCIAAHIESCKECQKAIDNLNQLGAHYFEQPNAITISPQLKDKVFAMLDEATEANANEMNTTQQLSPSSISKQSLNPNLPKCLQEVIHSPIEELEWKTYGKSIKTAKLFVDNSGAIVELIHIKAGGKTSLHTHRGEEFTLVLDGSFSDETGLYHKGDFVYCDQQHMHQPVATSDSDCLCLTVTNAPLHFKGLFSRFLNPLFKREFRNNIAKS